MGNRSGWRDAFADVFDVLLDAGRLLIRHWPVALAWAFVGGAWRGGVLWAAVRLSDHQPELGRAMLLLAPLGFLIPLIVILHRFRADLPYAGRVGELAGPPDATTGRPRRLLDVATSVLVPFLAVYVSYGFLAQDLDQFVNEAGADEFYNQSLDFYGTGQHADWSRIQIPGLETLVLIVAGAWILRFAVGKVEKRWRFLVLALLGAAVELYWTSNVAEFSAAGESDAKSWLGDRVIVTGTQDRYQAVVHRLGPFAHPVRTVTDWLFGILGSFDAIVVVPLAWITVAAVVLGHKLAPAPPLHHRAAGRAAALPAPVRRAGGLLAGLFDDIRSRFAGLWNGIRLMARAGLLPMLLFALAFLVALRVPALVSLIWRHVVGPIPSHTFVAFSPIEDAVGQAVSLVVLAVLLGAAVDRMLLPTSARRADSGDRTTTVAPG